MNFTHLHLASAFSFKYGTTLPDDLVLRAAEFGMDSLALTDRDTLAGAIRFAISCANHSIKPIIGIDIECEEQSRITLLATNSANSSGWSSLVRLTTELKRTGQPCSIEFLRNNYRYTKNLLALHGPNSLVSRALLSRRYDKALAIFNQSRELFANQAIECVSHLESEGIRSTSHAARVLGFARDNDLPALLTNAVRMRERSDAPVADILDAARHLLPLHKNVVERKNSEAFLKSSAEMVEIADLIAKGAGERSGKWLLRATREWAESAQLSPNDLGLGSIHLPEPGVVGAADQLGLVRALRERCYSGIEWRYGSKRQDVVDRLEQELSIIKGLGYESYFLTVADVTDRARNSGIRVAARGSGAGSLVCHLLGISGVEPLSLGLLMERFCSPLRNALPDIDIDVESARRLEIYDQVFSAYGERAATVAMFDTYRARHAIRDVGAAMSLPPMEIDLVAKSLPHIRARNISKSLANLPELKNLNLTSPTWKMAIGLAERLDGLPRNLAMHPCAVVLSDIGLYDRAPIEKNASGYPMIPWDKDDVEAIGLLKLDILGVRMQSSLAYSVGEIKRERGEEVDIDAIPLDDRATFELIQSTKTLGLFQIESPGQRELVGKFAPETFTDLIIDISLFRPGPVKSDMITPFLNARQGWKPASLIHPDLAPILSDTEGVVVFHEQVIEIISVLAGVTLAEADEKRRALGDREGQQAVCDWFFPRATKRGYSIEVITEVWDVLRAFASFGFCKAHAAAFALPTYQSAWLKTHYPAAFLSGVLTHDPGMYPKRLILDEVRQSGIKIAPLDVNRSDRSYRVEERTAIRLALADVNGISGAEIDSIIKHRPFIDIADFVHRSGVSKPSAEALLMVGAFDSLYESGLNRRDLLLHLNDLYKWSRTSGKSKLNGSQMTLGFAPPLAKTGLPDLRSDELVRNEIEYLGMDVSHHMIEFYADFLNKIGAVRSSDLLKQRSKSEVLVAGVKVALQTPPVRSGKRVMFLTLDDGFGCSDSTFFEDMQKSCAETLRNSSLLLVRGEIRRTGPRGISLRATGAWDLSSAYSNWRNLAACE